MTESAIAAVPAESGAAALAAARPRRFRWNASLIAGAAMMTVLVLVAILAPALLWEQATVLGAAEANQGASAAHWFGVDGRGHDVFARALVATRATLLMAGAATAVSVVGGVAVGVGIQLSPRRVREAAMRVVEAAVAFPSLLVALVIAAILGKGAVQVVVAIGVAGIAGFARLAANLAASLSQREFVATARLLGVPGWRLATRHMVPNMAEPLLVLAAHAFAIALVEVAALSFVGLGVQVPAFDLGTMLAEALQSVRVLPVRVVAPALVIVFASLAAMFIGDGLAATADPRSAGRRSRLFRSAAPADAARAASADAGALLVADHIVVAHAETGRMLVKGVSFTIRKGEILGIVGESGSGKSLTASVVGGLVAEGLDGSARRLVLGETDLLARPRARWLATSIGLVYQETGTALNPALALGSQLSDVLMAHRGMNRRRAREKVLDGFRSVLLSDPEARLGQRPYELSGGMRQRALISAAMNVDPALLIADEPTTALDVTVQREVLRVIRRMNRERGTAVLFISHDISVVRALCDRVIVMRDGEIVERVDDARELAGGRVTHPYTKRLLAAVPQLAPSPAPGLARMADGRADAEASGTPSGERMLEVTGLEVAYGRTTILRGVDASLARGRTLGLVGESGSGKTTLARAIVGAVRPRAGAVRAAGLDLGRASRRELAAYRRRVQLIPQDPSSSLSPRRTVGESISEALDPSGASASSANRDAVATWLERVGLEAGMVRRYPHELSGGERQRVAIARALIVEPELVIADEIASALDASVQAQVLQLMAQLKEELALTAVFISHDLALVRQVSDDLIVLHDGEIVEAGPADRIYADPRHWYTRRLLASDPSSPGFSLD